MPDLSFVFAMEIDGKPTIAFEAKNSREASGLCKEEWLRSDFSVLRSNGVPLWSAAAKLKVRQANELETQIYESAKRNRQAFDDLLLVYLVELDELAPDEQPDPGAFPPRRP